MTAVRSTDAVRQALATIQDQPAWALVRLQQADTVWLVGGDLQNVTSIANIGLGDGPASPDRPWDALVAVPFRQIHERGFAAIDDNTPLATITTTHQYEVDLAALLQVLPAGHVQVADAGGFTTSDTEYADIVARAISDEIGHGQAANLVIGRRYQARIADWSPTAALQVYRHLLEEEHGAYWTFAMFTGERYLIGASPERHVSVHAGDVRMNPISGTFRLNGLEPAQLKPELLKFLADEKEIFELFMVVDEELKMMCDICEAGGQVLGPFLKPMSHLVHTEYLLAGRTERDVREVLTMSLFAATVTGAPVEAACELLTRYEPDGRGYYAGAMALIGRDQTGARHLDSPILIRTAEIDLDGNVSVTAGATLVRDSDPASETAETGAKASAILGAFGLMPRATSTPVQVAHLVADEDVLIALGARNKRLSRFWLTDQSDTPIAPQLAGKQLGILHGGDDFAHMLARVLGVVGMVPTIVHYRDWTPDSFTGSDIVIVGPGPGDARDDASPKISTYRAVINHLLQHHTPFLAVSLGHEVLAHQLGFKLTYKDIVFQGTQSRIPWKGSEEAVGFYNTFVARSTGVVPDDVEVVADAATGDIHLLRGPTYYGVQFHAESVMSENGTRLLQELLHDLLP